MKSIWKNVEKFIKENYHVDNFDDLQVLWDNENLVFSVKEIVFRLTNFVHRSEGEIDTELKLLQVLFNTECSVVEIINSVHWNTFEKYNPEELYITAFQKAKWEIIDIDDFDEKDKIIRTWWRTMWKIHKTTCQNSKELNIKSRLEWDEEIIIDKADYLLPDWDNIVLSELNKILERFSYLQKNNKEYWLVHTDMRPRNFHYYDWEIIHFDFDDISNNWYIYDVAVAAFHETEQYETKGERTDFMKKFLITFIWGYLEEKEIEWIYLDHFMDFMKIRLIYAYIDYYKRLKIKWVDSWKEKMLGRKVFIESFEGFIDINEIEKVLHSLKK